MAEIKRTILLEYDINTGKLIDENGRAISSFKDLELSQKRLQKEFDRTEAAAEKTGKALQKTGGKAGLASATAFELGRTISDLPFGLTAVTNNLSQLGTQFAGLVRSSQGVAAAFKALRSVLAGPAGVLIAYQAFIAIVEVFAQRSRRAEKEANAFTEAISKAGSELKILVTLLEQQNLQFEQTEVLLKQANDNFKGLSLSVEDSQQALDSNITSIKEYITQLEKAAEAKAFQTLIEKQFQEIAEIQNDQANDTIKSYDFLGKAVRGLKNVSVSVLEFITGASISSARVLDDAQAKLNALLVDYENFLRSGFLGDPNKAEKDAKKLLELQQELALARIKSEKNRLIQELLFIDDRLKAEKEGEEEYIKLQIKREGVVDKINNLNEKTTEEEGKRRRKMLELQREFTLMSISDDILRLQQRILFIDKDLRNEKEGTERYLELQNEKKKALLDIAKLENKNLEDSIKEEDKVNALRQRLTEKRVATNEKLERKWLRSQISSLETILQSQSLTDEQRAESELKLFELKERLASSEQASAESIVSSISTALNTIGDLFDAQAEREIAIETNKTNALNDQLRERLANEQLSAEERDKINQQIARNETELVKKENEINKKRFEQQKALQLAQASVELYRTAFLAYGSQLVIGDPTSPVRAQIAQAVAIASGLANIAMIARQQFTAKALPSPVLTSQGGGASSSPMFNVVGASTQNQLAAAIAGQNERPIRTYVVSSDVSSAQELDRRIVEGASI